MQVSVEKPGSPSDILEHHGVKGQKWGVRKQLVRGAGVGAVVGALTVGVVPGAVLGVGGAYIGHLLTTQGDTKLSEIRSH